MTKWSTDANQHMTAAQKYLKADCLSLAASALYSAERLIPRNLTKQSEKAWTRFSKLNDKLSRAYGA